MGFALVYVFFLFKLLSNYSYLLLRHFNALFFVSKNIWIYMQKINNRTIFTVLFCGIFFKNLKEKI